MTQPETQAILQRLDSLTAAMTMFARLAGVRLTPPLIKGLWPLGAGLNGRRHISGSSRPARQGWLQLGQLARQEIRYQALKVRPRFPLHKFRQAWADYLACGRDGCAARQEQRQDEH